jgi:signal transduction histidine kinase
VYNTLMLWVRRAFWCRTAWPVVLAVAGLLSWASPAYSATVSDPVGTLINGWYKDQFSVEIRYGNGNCTNKGKANRFTFTAGAAYEGTHDYHFMADLLDNPYLAIDSSPPSPLVVPQPCAASVPTPVRDFNALRLDASVPTVSITEPSGSITTTQSTYRVAGEARDSASGVTRVRLMINGVFGPDAAVGGAAFSAVINLSMGPNTVTAVAYDAVGHESGSNTVFINRTTSNGGGSGPLPPPNIPTTISRDPRPASTPTEAGQAAAPVATLFSPDLPKLRQASTNPADEVKSPDLSSKGIRALVLMLVLLLAATGGYIWLAPRLPGRQGLRRKIILTVILPAIVPLVALGIAGYQQLSETIKGSLSDQLAKASSATALKLEREFDIRQTVFISTASSIIQLKNHYNQRRAELLRLKDGCSLAARSLIPRGRFDQVVANADCAPFLAGFARLADPSPNSLNDYLNAINNGYDQALAQLNREDQERTDHSLAELKLYFPETLDVAVVDASTNPQVLAALPTPNGKHLLSGRNDLFARAQSVNISTLVESDDRRQLIMGYPVSTQGGGHLGAVLVSYDPDHNNFIRPTWQTTPKPHAEDSVLIVDQAGQLIYPRAKTNRQATSQFAKAAQSRPGSSLALRLGSQDFTGRATRVGGTNWTVLVAASSESVLKPLVGVQVAALMAIGVSILLALVLGYIFATAITRQLTKLTKGAQAFAAGDLDHKITVRSHDELETLAETMDQMAGKIKAAQAALAEKDKEFIYVATHELRAPLTAAIGNLSMLAEGDGGRVDATAKETINQAYLSTQRLRELVNDLLDIARLDAGKSDFDLKPQGIADVTKSVVDMQQVVANSHKLKLSYQAPSALPKVLADESKLKIILTNLVSNAIKYNRAGGSVTVSHAVKGRRLFTTVTDTGLGIPKDQQGRIFEKFFRVKSADRTDITGTGLGMHITKRFVEAMGGKIGFTSTAGKGTSFSFSLPLASAVPPVAPAPSATTP